MSDDYPADWNSRRKKVYENDNYKCRKCGAKGGSRGSAELHAHHITPISEGGKHNHGNLKTLCKSCHSKVHSSNSSNANNNNEESLWWLLLWHILIIVGSIVIVFSFIANKLNIPSKVDSFVESNRKRNLNKYGTENVPYWQINGLMILIYLLSVCWIVIQQKYILYIPLTVALWVGMLPMYLYQEKYCTVENSD